MKATHESNESTYTMSKTATAVFEAAESLVDCIRQHFAGVKSAETFGAKRAELVNKTLVAPEFHSRIPVIRATLARLVETKKIKTFGWVHPNANKEKPKPKLTAAERKQITQMLSEYAALSANARKEFRAQLRKA